MPTVEEALSYMGIDYADDMVKRNVTRAIRTAEAYIKGAVGKDVDWEDPRTKEVALIVTDDFYSNRGVTQGMHGFSRKLVDDLLLQLRLERGPANGI